VGGVPTIRDIANHLLLRHHSVVGLIDRAELAGLVERRADPDDQRVVRVHLTSLGARRLASLAAVHLEELKRLEADLTPMFPQRIEDASPGRY
jgi:DNA-binding MarR family transcriptional regulator